MENKKYLNIKINADLKNKVQELKALNIRDYENNSEHRKAMGHFKHMANTLGKSQAEMLKYLVDKEYYKMTGIE